MPLPPPLRGLRAAFVFLTRLPVGGFPYRDADWRWSGAHFPLVGAALGAAMALAWLAARPLGPLPAGCVALAASMLLTGGFHEDGLADTADALGGAYTRERILEILKDSRIGAFGAMALAITIALRLALLAELCRAGDTAVVVALVVSQALSRLPPIWLMALLPYATSDSRTKSRQVNRAGLPQALVAAAWCALLLGALIRAGAPLDLATVATLALAAAATATLCGWRFHRRLGGVTGDFLGATQQLSEIALLAVLVLASR
jgi:adenosylcobinamide-GDP ribazoletransferase